MVVKNQIKSLLLSHHHSTSALVSEILESVLQTVQKTKRFTYRQYIFTDCTEDNVQNTHTRTQYTQCTIKTVLVTNTLYVVTSATERESGLTSSAAAVGALSVWAVL